MNYTNFVDEDNENQFTDISQKFPSPQNRYKYQRILNTSMDMKFNPRDVYIFLAAQDLSQPEEEIFGAFLDSMTQQKKPIIDSKKSLSNSSKKLKELKTQIGFQSIKTKTNYVCPICLEILPSDQLQVLKMSCGHFFCLYCFREYLKAKIEDRFVGLFLCPQEKCQFAIPEHQIFEFLNANPELRRKFENTRNNHLVGTNPDLKWCTRPGCENLVELIENSETQFVKCACGNEFCFNCNNPVHKGFTCKQNMDKIFSNYAQTHNLQFLPNREKCKMQPYDMHFMSS